MRHHFGANCAHRRAVVLTTDRTKALRRYILGLALVAFTYPQERYLRQGCNLVPDPDKPAEVVLVHHDGRREPFSLTHGQALEFAQEAAKAFGVGASRTVPFDRSLAEKDVKGEDNEGKKGKGKGKSKGKETES